MGGFRVDVDAVDLVGSTVRSSVEGADVLIPSGPGGCGSALVASVWDQVCARLLWAVADRLLPAVALWGARIEGAGRWCRERDQALSGLHEGGIAQLPGLQVRFVRPGGSGFGGSGGSGPVWDADDPYVTAIEGDTIVVQNPWGRSGDTEAATLRLTEEEFDRTFTWASAGRS